ARRSQRRGQGFDPPHLHQDLIQRNPKKCKNPHVQRVFCVQISLERGAMICNRFLVFSLPFLFPSGTLSYVNKKQRKTLADIYEKPTRCDVSWRAVESLFKAIGADIFEGRGSRVSVVFDQRVLDIHKPHPSGEMKKYAVEKIRDFLAVIGVKP
ncbi:MAG TPA: type II toxin-antitoxin system HicA family toxin, partial [Smithellaceae bacterium]|nr:type II toxin-antitoxin system HicA family toxin [Smithellaceae bacterium]